MFDFSESMQASEALPELWNSVCLILASLI